MGEDAEQIKTLATPTALTVVLTPLMLVDTYPHLTWELSPQQAHLGASRAVSLSPFS